MPRPKKYAELEDKILQAIVAEIDHHVREFNMTPEEARAAMLNMKKDGKFSYKSMTENRVIGEFKSPEAKAHWNEVTLLAQRLVAKHNPSNKLSWWQERIMPALPEKVRMTGVGKRKVGEISAEFSKTAQFSAMETARKGESLYGVFGDETVPLLAAMNAIDKGDTTFTNECCDFTEDKKMEIALLKLEDALKRVAELQINPKMVNDSIGGLDPKEFLVLCSSNDGLEGMEEECRKHARAKAEANGVTDENTIQAAGSLSFLTLAHTAVQCQNIYRLLDHPNCCAQQDKDGIWRIFIKGDEEMSFEQCVGILKRDGFPVEECVRTLVGWQHTFIEVCNTSDEPLVVDMDAKKDPTNTKSDNPLYKKIQIPGDEKHFAKPATIGLRSTKPVTFQVAHISTISLHRVTAIFMDHFGCSFHRNPLIKEYLKLKDGESFEDHERFKYRQDLSDEAIQNRLRRESQLKKKNWDERKMAKFSDVDHLVGRSQKWKNSNFFCMHVSHSWNRAMAYVRIMYGDWIFGFASIKYGTSND